MAERYLSTTEKEEPKKIKTRTSPSKLRVTGGPCPLCFVFTTRASQATRTPELQGRVFPAPSQVNVRMVAHQRAGGLVSPNSETLDRRASRTCRVKRGHTLTTLRGQSWWRQVLHVESQERYRLGNLPNKRGILLPPHSTPSG